MQALTIFVEFLGFLVKSLPNFCQFLKKLSVLAGVGLRSNAVQFG